MPPRAAILRTSTRACALPELAHHEIALRRKNRSQSGDSRHGQICCRLDPIVNDPGCVKTRSLADGAESLSQLSSAAEQHAPYASGNAIWKNDVPCILPTRDFSHSLDPERTIIRVSEVLIRRRASRCCGNTAWGGSTMTSGFIDIEGDSLARGRADRVERKTLRYQRVYA